MIQRPPGSTRTDTLFPYTSLCRSSAKTIAAIEMLRDLNRSGKRDLAADAPMPFRKEWRKIVVGDDGKINRRLWEIATIAHLRNKLRSGDVWVERSAGYRRFDNSLQSGRASCRENVWHTAEILVSAGSF